MGGKNAAALATFFFSHSTKIIRGLARADCSALGANAASRGGNRGYKYKDVDISIEGNITKGNFLFSTFIS